MPIESFQRALQTRQRLPSSQLPSSGVVGLALPIAALGIVLIGMDLHLLGLLAWTAAIIMIAFVLERFFALAAVALVALSGILLWRLLLGSAPVLSGAEQTAFALVTALAAVVGQLGASEMRAREQQRRVKSQSEVFSDTINVLFENSRDCIKLLAADGTVLAINKRGLKLTGASDGSQMVGQNWFAFWDSEQQKALAAAWHTALVRGDGAFEGTCRILTGERRSWCSTFALVRMPENPQPYIVCISHDVTENLAARQTLKASVAQLSSLIDSLDEAFFALDANWTINFANQRSEQLYAQLGHSSVLGSNFWDVFPIAPGEPAAVYIRRAMERQSVQRCEYFHAAQQIWLSITAFPYPNGISVLVRDITPLKQAEKTATEENARLQVAQEIAGFGDWSFDYEHGLMRFSPRAVTMLELEECPPHEYKKRLLERLHTQDRMALIQAIINSSAEAARIDLIVRMPTENGVEKHLHWVGQLIVDEHGSPLRMLGALQDVSAHLSAQQTLEKARRVVRDMVDALPQQIFVIDRAGNFVTVNRAWEDAWRNLHGSAATPANFFDSYETLTPAERDIGATAQEAARAILSDTIDRLDHEYEVVIHGERRQFVMHALPLHTGGQTLVVFTHNEVTSVKRLISAAAENEKMMYELAEHLPEIFWTYDVAAAAYTHVSPAFEKIYQIAPDVLLRDRKALMQFIHPDDHQHMRVSMRGTRQGKSENNCEYRIIDAGGELHWLSSNSVSLRDEHNNVTRVIGVTRDITVSKNYEQHLFASAYTDDLTGLQNRKALMMLIDKRAQQAQEKSFALILVNIDRFKNINDTLGHGCGDDLLKQAAKRLRLALPDAMLVARAGGDEFAIICEYAQQQAVIDAAMACFIEAFQLQDELAYVTVSLGVAASPYDSEDSGELLKFAGAALQRAKTLGRNNCQLFKDTMLLPSRERLALENELRTALQRGEFELFYQGKFDLKSGALVGAEALLRWNSHKRGLVSPADFIPLLEETGLILPVGDWILAEACQQVQHWHQHCGAWLPVAVNVSALQVSNRAFADKAIAILQNSELPANVIELEITESALMSDASYGAQLIKTLKAAGFSIALDDFGTGYSSLGYLRKFLPSTLKIDRSFIADLTTGSNDQQIVSGIVQLAKALKIEVVAEGIELIEQRNILCEMGCGRGQGFLFCRPLPAMQFEQNIMAPQGFKAKAIGAR
ncbi:MAG TPA: EAL domain-containing protein [Spongiibacteraceae bacterium]